MIQTGDRTFAADELEVPAIRPGHGLLRVEACGLCGSDVEQYKGSFAAKGLIQYPVIPGHEPVGILEDVHPDAEAAWGVSSGDRVALIPLLSCGRCETCLSGSHHRCRRVYSDGAPSYGYLPLDYGDGLWGGYSDYIYLHPRTLFVKVPPSIPPQLATMYQALASGLRWAVDVPAAGIGDCVLVMGCGQRGLASVVALRAAGIRDILVTGLSRDAGKLEVALSLGATAVIDVEQENMTESVMDLTRGQGVDIAVDVVPAATEPLVEAVECVRPGGTIVMAGIKGGDRRTSLDTDRVLYKEITLRGVFTQPASAYERAMELLERQLAELAPLHTHDFALEDADRAVRTVAGEIGDGTAICAAIRP